MSSVRRLKERGGSGGGAKITASATTSNSAVEHQKSLTPQSEKPISSHGCGGKESLKKPTGKENSRSTSRGRAATVQSQKPIMEEMPSMDKFYAGVGNDGDLWVEGRPRRSPAPVSVLVQRGRSSSPSEFNRVFLISGKSRISSVEKKRVNFKGINEEMGEKRALGMWVTKNLTKSGEIFDEKVGNVSSNFVKFTLDDSDETLYLSRNVNNGSFMDEKMDSCLGNGVEFSEKELKPWSLGILEERDGDESSMRNKSGGFSGRLKEKEVGEIDSWESRMVDRLGGVSGILKTKDGNENRQRGSSGNVKYPSKFCEKLACLEGKVKSIASDIKRTNEVLDMNNPDNSKMILSDIQEKVLGTEKAIGSVVNNDDSKANVVASCEIDDEKVKVLEMSQDNKVNEGKRSNKGLNADGLEAGLFPHHKLVRDMISLKSASESAQHHEIEWKVEKKSVNPVDKNPIATEFLASIGQEQYDDTIRVGTSGLEICEVQETDGPVTTTEDNRVSNILNEKGSSDIDLLAHESFEDFGDPEDNSEMSIEGKTEDSSLCKLNEIGRKTTTGGWFVSEGEFVLLVHDDGSCSYHDIINNAGKVYKPPGGVSPNMWRDCWLIRAPGADGCSGQYVIAASAGSSTASGFCSWDFSTCELQTFYTETGTSSVKTDVLSTSAAPANQQWWYRPCGPLIASAASCQRKIRVYDVRDGEHIMHWKLQKPLLGMDYSSPLQWRNKGEVVIAESEAISLWDVNSLYPEELSSLPSPNCKIVALHVNNTDAELGGGVRQRVSFYEAQGNDGVFCTSDFISILDFRQQSGIGLRIPTVGVDVQSTFSRGDSVFVGCTNPRSAGKKSQIQQYSLRKQMLCSTYVVPESDAHSDLTAITQVWGDSKLVMGVSGQGLFVFDALKNSVVQSLRSDSREIMSNVREVIGPNDMCSPSFDYLASQVLLISRDRPARWRYLL
ncbi:hypothetical protein ACH5RR_032991 [Cinchona calisaya]|uniref:At4g14310 8-bladed propeller domain-containing protein n=1 Tax=Cinchona calisaya TaxID=153742 RepID=A0ABD2YNW1_9GENT